MPIDMTEPRPAVTEALLDILQNRFGLAPVHGPVDLGGEFSLNVRVDAAEGRFVARVHGTQTEPARLSAIQHARRALSAGGVPAPERVAARDGAPFVELDGHQVEVERYVEHDADMNTWQRLEVGLPFLGRVHTLFRSLNVGPAGRHAPLANHIEPREALAGALDGVQFMRSWDLSSQDRALADAFEELARSVDEAERGVVEGFPRQLVHGDFWDNNVLLWRDAVVLVIDLDFMAERLRIDDLALTLFFANSSIGGDRLGDERIRQMRVLVDAYDSGLSDHLSIEERRALPAAIARQTLWSIGWWVPRLPEEIARRHPAARAVDVVWTLELMRDLKTWQEAFTA
jgi:Ser/Thr protein kinase RdoA (MazF antagonist)